MRRLTTAIVCLVLAAACGGSPTTPAPGGGVPVPAALSFDGVWQLEYRIAECTGERHCIDFIGTTRKITARILSAGTSLVGVVSDGTDNIDVSGTLSPDGSATLAGVRQAALPADYAVEVSRLHLRHTESGVSGWFDYGVTAPVAIEWPFRSARKGGAITAATRIAGLPGPGGTTFTGTWEGRVAIRDCSSVGWQHCHPLAPQEVWKFTLAMAESGGRVTGLFERPSRTPVEGTVSGLTLQLHGTGEEAGGGYRIVTTVRPSTFTRDALGRLRGTMGVEMRWLWHDGRVSSTDYRVIELLNVLLKLPS